MAIPEGRKKKRHRQKLWDVGEHRGEYWTSVTQEHMGCPRVEGEITKAIKTVVYVMLGSASPVNFS